MKILDCANRVVHMTLAQCADTIATARAHHPKHGSIDLVHTHDPSTHLAALTFPEDTKQGVYTIKLTTNCGCFTSPVYFQCHPPTHLSDHWPTRDPDAPLPAPECDPEP